MFVIRRNDGAYVARPGSAGSYTRSLESAWKFYNREEADKQRCPGNETVVSVEDILR